VSPRLRDVFARLEPDHTDFQDVALIVGAKPAATYHFVQILDNVDAIDWAKSDVDSYPDDRYGITSVRKLVLDVGATLGRNAFRIEGLATDLAVSDAFRAAVEAERMTGIRFKPVGEFKL
jgi:hypothetical protein